MKRCLIKPSVLRELARRSEMWAEFKAEYLASPKSLAVRNEVNRGPRNNSNLA